MTDLERRLRARVEQLEALINSPLHEDFLEGVKREAAHQVERWGEPHDARKEPQDWFWTLGYLAGKALRAHIDGDRRKALHHTISSAALLLNWHRRILAGNPQPPTTRCRGPSRQLGADPT